VQESGAPKHTCSARRSPRFHRPSWKSVTAQQFRSPLSSEHSWGLVRPVSRYDFCEALHSIGRGLLYCTARLAFGSLPVVLADGSEVESFGMPPPAGAFHLQRLKDKLGNRSNASSEVEYDGAYGQLVGEEGRGVATGAWRGTIDQNNAT